MAITQLSDVVDPEVIADLTTDILFAKTMLLNSPYVEDGSDQIYQDGGNTLTFPSWDTDTAGVVQDQVSTRTGVTPSKVTMAKYTEEVVDKIISFDVHKHVLSDIIRSANPNLHIAEIVAAESQLEIQKNAIMKAEGTDLLFEDTYLSNSDGLLTVDAILAAKMQWGEHAAGVTPGLFVHSKQFTDLAKSDDFKALGTATTNNAIVNAAAAQGGVAMVHGCVIYLLDSITRKGGTVSSITRAAGVMTVTTAGPHGFKVGDKAVIASATEAEYNGEKVITGVPTATTFTAAVSGTPTTPSAGGAVIRTRYESLMMLPGALWFVLKQAMESEVHKHAGSPIRTMDFDFRYCTTRRRVKPRRTVRFSTR